VAALAVTAPACNIKENRDDCPCDLSIRSMDVPVRLKMSGIRTDIVGEGGQRVLLDTISSSDFGADDRFHASVPRGKVSVSGVSGAEMYECVRDGLILQVRTGEEADSVFAHVGYVDCHGERAVDTLQMHKQWCGLTLHITGTERWQPYTAVINGNWCGFLTSDLSPIEGDFICEPRSKGVGVFEARIPRQGDDDLTFTITKSESDTVLCSYEIGTIMAEAGYDWSRTDLDDILINIDRATGEISVELTPWYPGKDYGNITI